MTTLDALEGLHGVVAVRRGETILEHYGTGPDASWARQLGVVEFGPETLHDLRSITKSITAILYGTALAAGHVPEPSEPLLRSFPRYPDLAADPSRARLTVEHALTMSLGLEWREDPPYTSPDNAEIAMELAPDRYRYILSRPIAEPPGNRWNYCGGASALLGALISEGTGCALPEYARLHLFEPLGIDSSEWITGADGVPSAASGLRLTPRALARIGTMILADGDGVVPASWLATMLQPRLATDWGGQYGYQWYIEQVDGHHVLAAMGNGGQRLFVLPELSLVVAVTCGNYDGNEQWVTPLTVLRDFVLPNCRI
ncbi:serine hydrolase domain-containing protein [Dactylosporangium sp. CS-047395]|uniref:serine hydrolase domain-containing protein n=1 Tax=Dactylosporangium sp. CS-047395 TaxID=3239936 RepID=UPI003D93FAD2